MRSLFDAAPGRSCARMPRRRAVTIGCSIVTSDPTTAWKSRLVPADSTWGVAGDDLNATPVRWPPGAGTADAAIAERELLIIVVAGTAAVTVDGDAAELTAGDALLIAAGARWRLTAGPDGVRYLSVHRRRGPIQIRR